MIYVGPWAVQGEALSSFAVQNIFCFVLIFNIFAKHNPNVVRDTDGAWLLFHIGVKYFSYNRNVFD